MATMYTCNSVGVQCKLLTQAQNNCVLIFLLKSVWAIALPSLLSAMAMHITPFPETNIWDYLTPVLFVDMFRAFLHRSIFNEVVFCLGEKQGLLLINNECSSWYN